MFLWSKDPERIYWLAWAVVAAGVFVGWVLFWR
jgi:hypothetical protein